MHHANLLRPTLLAGLFAVLAPGLAADVLRVDTYGTAEFQEIQAAVDAAAEGDTILVHRPPLDTQRFGGFVIDGKSLTVVGPDDRIVATGPVTVRNLQPGQAVVLSDLGIHWNRAGVYLLAQTIPSAIGLRLENNAGAVLVQGCEIAGSDEWDVGTDGRAACAARASTDCTLRDCTLVGGMGGEQALGGSGIRASDSDFVLYDTSVRGGYGRDHMPFIGAALPGDGGCGVTLTGSSLYASGSVLTGGSGGSALYGEPSIGGEGGAALVVSASSTAFAVEGEIVAGAGGSGMDRYGPDGEAVVGTLEVVPGSAPRLDAVARAVEASELALHLTGLPGQAVELLVSPRVASRFLGSRPGFLHAGAPFHRASLGILPASGELTLDYSLPEAPSGASLGLVLQAVFLGPGGAIRLSGPRHVSVLDELALPPCGGRVHVDASASPGGDGSSWATAFHDLHAALLAVPGCAEQPTEVWVAEGEYRPDVPGGDRKRSFILFPGTHVYGGFAGSETLLAERDPEAYPVLLNGDLLGDDAPDFANRADNSYHVVEAGTFLYPAKGVRIDGLRVRGGFVGGSPPSGVASQGGGMLLNGEVDVVGCVIDDCLSNAGGGIFFRGERFRLLNSRVIGNTASVGGGVSCSMTSPESVVCVVGSVFAGNLAEAGAGALWTHGTGSIDASRVDVRHCAFYANVAFFVPGGFRNIYAEASVTNCIFWGNCTVFNQCGQQDAQIGDDPTVTLDYCLVQGLDGSLGGVGNVDGDPLFVDPLGPDGIAGTLDDDLTPGPGSAAIDAGSNALAAADDFDVDGDGDTGEPLPFDLAGDARFVDDPSIADTGEGAPPVVDIGPLERNP